MKILKFEQINENKMWYKTIPEMLEWLELKSKIPFTWIDTETTGLNGPKNEQLTQVSAIATKYNFSSNTFDELGTFDEKIKLTSEIKTRYKQPDGGNRRVLSFNHYGSGNYKYKDEKQIVNQFFDWTNEFSPCLFIAQNAAFDMQMLACRYGHKIKNEVFDTKMLIQLYFLPLIQKLAETDPKYKEMVNTIGISARDNGLISSSMSKILAFCIEHPHPYRYTEHDLKVGISIPNAIEKLAFLVVRKTPIFESRSVDLRENPPYLYTEIYFFTMVMFFLSKVEEALEQ